MVQFVDFLASKASKEEAIEAFSNLDMEGEGLLEVTWLLAVSTNIRDVCTIISL